MDKKEIKKMVFMAPLDWVTLSPLVVGFTLGIVLWVAEARSGLMWFMSVLCLLGSALTYCTRLFTKSEEYEEKILERMRLSTKRQRDEELNELGHQLEMDGDPRTERFLQDLIVMRESVAKDKGISSRLAAMGAYDVIQDVDELFQVSVSNLRESLKVLSTANKLSRNSPARKKIMEHRERLILEVESGLEQLGDIVGGLEGASEDTAKASGQVDRVRRRISDRLRIAKELQSELSSGWSSEARNLEKTLLQED